MPSDPLAFSHLSEAKRALLAKRLKGRDDVPVRQGRPAPTALLLDPSRYRDPYPVRGFVAERLRYCRAGTGDFRMPIETRTSGLDADRLRAAWQTLYRDTEAMRSRIRDGMLSVDDPDRRYDIAMHDARRLSGSAQQQLIADVRGRFESLSRDAGCHAVEVELIRTADRESTCFYSFDLLVLDLPSIELLALWCRQVYENRYRPKARLHTQDYRRTEDVYCESQDGQLARRYWERRIAQSGPRLSARQLAGSATDSAGYGYLCKILPRTLWEKAKARARARGVSELVAVQVSFTDFLAYTSGMECFAYETRSFQRLPFHPDIYDLLGQFTLGHLTGRHPDDPQPFVERVKAEIARIDRDAPYAFFDIASHWQSREGYRTQGAKIVFTDTCNRFAEFVQAGRVPPMRWLGEYVAIRQYTPDTALEYVLVENDGDLEIHWFLDHRRIPMDWARGAYALYFDALIRLCEEDAAWDLPNVCAPAAAEPRR